MFGRMSWQHARRRVVLASLALFVLIAGVAAVVLLSGSDDKPTRRAAVKQLRGFQYTAWFDDDDRTIGRRLDEIRAAGGNVVRAGFVWPIYEPRPGEIDNKAIDRFVRFVDAAERRGIKVIWLLGGSPCEYAEMPPEVLARCKRAPRPTRRPEFITWPPSDEGAWRNSLRLVLERVGDRLAAAEVWNEPNLPEFFRTDGNRVEDYVRIVRWTSEEIHTRTPGLPVLAGSIAGADVGFLASLYAHGLAGLADGISVHPYSYRPEQGGVATRPGAITFDADRATAFRSGLVAIREAMKRAKEGNLPIWITEFGSRPCSAQVDPLRRL